MARTMDVINFSGMLLFADGKELTQQQFEYLALFCDVPRFKRDVALLKDHPDPLREAVGLPLGAEGEFFVSSHEYQQLPDDSEKKKAVRFSLSGTTKGPAWYSVLGVVDSEGDLPAGMPGPDADSCNWRPSTSFRGIRWRCYSRRFPQPVEWLQWITDNILQRWGLRLGGGEIWYQESDRMKTGRIVVTAEGQIVKQDAGSGQIPNMLGAAASNDVALAWSLPPKQVGWRDKFGRTPFMLAAWFKAYEMLEWLVADSSSEELGLSETCKPETTRGFDFENETLFHNLARLDPDNTASQIALFNLSAHPIPPELLSSFAGSVIVDGPTPLCLAIERGNDLVAEWLVDKGADVNFRGPGLTYNPSGYAQYSWPMMTAAAVEDPYFLELLLENGARINCRHEPRWSLVHGHFSMGKMTPLHLAAYSGRFENVRLLAYYGADFSKVWYDQYSPKPGWHLDRVAGQQAQPVPSDHFSDSEYSDYESETERTARTARQGVIYASSKEAKSVQDLRDALQNFDAAVQEGLFRRRLLVLCGVTRGRGSPHIPEPLLIHIMELAGLFPVVKMSEDDEKQHKAEKSILEEERRSAGRNGAVKTGRSD